MIVSLASTQSHPKPNATEGSVSPTRTYLGLKPAFFLIPGGTTEVVPFPILPLATA
jgi:hypothetical protein